MTEEQFYNQLKKEVKRANQRLVRLERKFGENKWASKKLRDYLDTEKLNAWTKSSRVRINKSMSFEQLKAIEKQVDKFLKARTSTVRGVNLQIKMIKGGFEKNLDISKEEAESIYQAFEDDLLKWIFQYIEPSEFWAIMQEAKEYHYTKTKFINTIKQYIDFGNDLDIKEKLIAIYERYV